MASSAIVRCSPPRSSATRFSRTRRWLHMRRPCPGRTWCTQSRSRATSPRRRSCGPTHSSTGGRSAMEAGRTARRIRLTLLPIGASVVAELLDDEAPVTAAHVWDRLPIEGYALHGQYSGAEIFVLVDRPERLPPENLVHIPVPGELFYFYQ